MDEGKEENCIRLLSKFKTNWVAYKCRNLFFHRLACEESTVMALEALVPCGGSGQSCLMSVFWLQRLSAALGIPGRG